MKKLLMLMLVLTATSANAHDRWHHYDRFYRDPDKPHWRGDTNHERDQYGNYRWPQGQYSGNGSGDYYQPVQPQQPQVYYQPRQPQRLSSGPITTTCVRVNGGTSVCVHQ